MSGAAKSEVDRWLEGEGDRLVRGLGVAAGHRVLDFGCGLGSIAVPAARVVGETGRVLALDVDESALAAIRRRIAGRLLAERVELVPASGEPRFPGVAGGELNAIFVFDVLQHVSGHERLFAECRRCLSPGGVVHVNASELSHPGEVDVAGMVDALRAAGLEERGQRRVRLMHYRHMAEDIVRSFEVTSPG